MPKDGKKKPRKDSTSESDSGSGSEDREPAKKKVKPASDSYRTDDKEPTWDLGKSRFVKVSDFKGKVYINIREFYDAGGELKPSKKGIMLTGEQWQRFKASLDEIDEEFKKMC